MRASTRHGSSTTGIASTSIRAAAMGQRLDADDGAGRTEASALHELDGPVVVAVVLVGLVEVPVDEVVGVITVGNGLVAASGTVGVLGSVAGGRLGVPFWVGVRDRECVLVDVVVVRVVEMAVVQEVDVPFVTYGGVPAGRPVYVIVTLVGLMIVVRRHGLDATPVPPQRQAVAAGPRQPRSYPSPDRIVAAVGCAFGARAVMLLAREHGRGVLDARLFIESVEVRLRLFRRAAQGRRPVAGHC